MVARRVSERVKKTKRYQETKRRVDAANARRAAGQSSSELSNNTRSTSRRSSRGSGGSGITVIKGGTKEQQQKIADDIISGKRKALSSGTIRISDKAPIQQRIEQQEEKSQKQDNSSSVLSPRVQQFQKELQQPVEQAQTQAPTQRQQVQPQPSRSSSVLSPRVQQLQETLQQPTVDARQFTQQPVQQDFTPASATREDAAAREQVRNQDFINALEANREQSKQIIAQETRGVPFTIGPQSFVSYGPQGVGPDLVPTLALFNRPTIAQSEAAQALFSDIAQRPETTLTPGSISPVALSGQQTITSPTIEQQMESVREENKRAQEKMQLKPTQRDYTQEFINTLGDLQAKSKAQEFGIASPLVGAGAFTTAAGAQVFKSFFEEPVRGVGSAVRDPGSALTKLATGATQVVTKPTETILTGGQQLGQTFQENPGAAFGLTAATTADLALGFRGVTLPRGVTTGRKVTQATQTTGDIITTSTRQADNKIDIASAQSFRTLDEATQEANALGKQFTVVSDSEVKGTGVLTGRQVKESKPFTVTGKVTSKQKTDDLLVEGRVATQSAQDYNKAAKEILDIVGPNAKTGKTKRTISQGTVVDTQQQIGIGIKEPDIVSQFDQRKSTGSRGGGGRRVDTFISGTASDVKSQLNIVNKDANKISRDFLQSKTQTLQKGRPDIDIQTEFMRVQRFREQPPKTADIQKSFLTRDKDVAFITKDIEKRTIGKTTVIQSRIQKSIVGDLFENRDIPPPSILRPSASKKKFDIFPSKKKFDIFPGKRGQARTGFDVPRSQRLDIPQPKRQPRKAQPQQAQIDSILKQTGTQKTKIPFIGTATRVERKLSTPSAIKVKTITGISFTPALKMGSDILSRSAKSLSTSIISKSAIDTALTQDVTSSQKDKVTSVTDTKSRQAQDTQSDLVSRQRTSQTLSLSLPRPPPRPIPPKPKKPLFKIPQPSKQKIKKFPSYVGEVKQQGRWVQASSVPSTKKNALGVAAFVADNTPARSIRVRGTNLSPQKPIKPRLPNLKQFRKSKSLPGVLVEKSKFAINSPTEKRKITQRGLKAARNAKRFRL